MQGGIFWAGVLLALSGVCAQAEELVAELHMIEGKVLVNHGHGYVSAAGVVPGDKILVGNKSGAILSFRNGCDLVLKARQVYVVPAEPPCASTTTPQVVQTQPALQPAPPVVPPPVIDSTGLLIGGVVGAAALGGAAFLLLSGKNNTTSQPVSAP